MPTIAEHLAAIHERLDDFGRRLDALAADPLEQHIDLELPHASAGSAVSGDTAGREAIVETEVTDDSLTVRLPAATPERQAERRRFAEEVLDLNATFPGLEAEEHGLTAVDCYAKGGPQWLYLGSKEGRDHILTLPYEWRQAMVEDVAQDSTQAAHELGRDILKDAEPSAGMTVTYDYLLSTVDE